MAYQAEFTDEAAHTTTKKDSLRDRLMVVLDMDETLIHSQVEVMGAVGAASPHDPRQEEDRSEGQSSQAAHDFEFVIPIAQCPG